MPGSPFLPSGEKVETGKFLSSLLCIMGGFLVHSNPKGETLHDPSLMEGSPIKVSTLVFLKLYFPLPGPHEASKTELGGHQTPSG